MLNLSMLWIVDKPFLTSATPEVVDCVLSRPRRIICDAYCIQLNLLRQVSQTNRSLRNSNGGGYRPVLMLRNSVPFIYGSRQSAY